MGAGNALFYRGVERYTCERVLMIRGNINFLGGCCFVLGIMFRG